MTFVVDWALKKPSIYLYRTQVPHGHSFVWDSLKRYIFRENVLWLNFNNIHWFLFLFLFVWQVGRKTLFVHSMDHSDRPLWAKIKNNRVKPLAHCTAWGRKVAPHMHTLCCRLIYSLSPSLSCHPNSSVPKAARKINIKLMELERFVKFIAGKMNGWEHIYVCLYHYYAKLTGLQVFAELSHEKNWRLIKIQFWFVFV